MTAYYILTREGINWVIAESLSTKRDLLTTVKQLKDENTLFKVLKGERFQYMPGDIPPVNAKFLNEEEYSR